MKRTIYHTVLYYGVLKNISYYSNIKSREIKKPWVLLEKKKNQAPNSKSEIPVKLGLFTLLRRHSLTHMDADVSQRRASNKPPVPSTLHLLPR